MRRRSAGPPKIFQAKPPRRCILRQEEVNMHTGTTVFLLAEDDPHDAQVIEEEFAKAPAHVRLQRVRDGAESMEYMEGRGQFADRAQFPVPDVILMDLKMPRVDGHDFLHWLRHQAPEKMRLIPVIIMSTSTEEKDVNRSYEFGANSYVVKPFGWAKFQERIRELGIYWSEHSETPIVPDQAR
jgi:CheY-like chemotaxis protein